jgi:hypothetical protein
MRIIFRHPLVYKYSDLFLIILSFVWKKVRGSTQPAVTSDFFSHIYGGQKVLLVNMYIKILVWRGVTWDHQVSSMTWQGGHLKGIGKARVRFPDGEPKWSK